MKGSASKLKVTLHYTKRSIGNSLLKYFPHLMVLVSLPVFYLHRMLRSLTINNYALIDDLQLTFGKNLNIITGETGAGKSILLGALGLLLGQRADTSALLDNSRKCIIEGEFSSDLPSIDSFFKHNELDREEKLILRREITKEGKSRSFINDTPVNLSQLKEMGSLLVDIHSQHETLLLNKTGFQLSIVDAFAGHEKEIKLFRIAFNEFKTLLQELTVLKEQEKQVKAEADYLTFQLNELIEVNPVIGEQELLENELTSLIHSEEIRSGLSRMLQSISGEESNLITELSLMQQLSHSLSGYHPKLVAIAERIQSVLIEMKDLDNEIEHLVDEVLPDPKRQEIIQDRLDLLYRLEQKHRAITISDLIKVKLLFEEKLESINSMDQRILELEKKEEQLRYKLTQEADILSENRKKIIPSIESKIKKLLSEVAMPNANLKIECNALPEMEFNQTGKDFVRFLFSANKGVSSAEISKVASGGELSRLMLCLKAMVAKLIDMPTVIFDEIDTGVSGETAFKIGKLMQDFSKSRQLIAISHLPQIASRGEEHFFVSKEIVAKKTFTRVRRLSADERIVEVARMLSGDKPSAIAIENAKELLNT